jgi:hypothetical protein
MEGKSTDSFIGEHLGAILAGNALQCLAFISKKRDSDLCKLSLNQDHFCTRLLLPLFE